MRTIAWLVILALALIPVWFAWQELGAAYEGLWAMYEDYSFQKEILARSHALRGMFWMLVGFLLFEIADLIGSTREERRALKELMQKQKSEEALLAIQPQSASWKISRPNQPKGG